jgi:hypothetical protein
MKMCQLAFLPLNDETATTTIVISDAEFLSWQHAVQHLYVVILSFASRLVVVCIADAFHDSIFFPYQN